MPAYPSSLSLTNIADGALAVAADERNNFNAIQTYTNALLTALAVAAKGDILGATGANAVTPVTVGANGKVLVADSTQTAGLKWDYPPGYNWDYKEITADVGSITATTEGTAATIITSNSVTYDGAAVDIDVSISRFDVSGALTWTVVLLEDATVLGQLQSYNQAGSNPGLGLRTSRRRTPSAAAHVYTVKAFVSTGTLTAKAGTGASGTIVPASIKVTKV